MMTEALTYSSARRILAKYLDKGTGYEARRNKTLGFFRVHRKLMGRKLVEDMTEEERVAEFCAYAREDIEVSRQQTLGYTDEQIVHYLIERTLDPLDPLCEFYGEYLRRAFGADVIAGCRVGLPEQWRTYLKTFPKALLMPS